ncbi:hypothetical protein MHPYR_860006 [uncultured Mycobacterium sp.]|uniref:Uncharacterized protein n=1 Tax=uncultured Mycobacterium sp. TaxID=171292 RepID=A0A1Y5PLU3_9MYCO|nr:hypothetical protein MHPYR_860006 [uncultured Mycobacterium sp.]
MPRCRRQHRAPGTGYFVTVMYWGPSGPDLVRLGIPARWLSDSSAGKVHVCSERVKLTCGVRDASDVTLEPGSRDR